MPYSSGLYRVKHILVDPGTNHVALCHRSYDFMKSAEMDFIRERANISYTYGNMENMFAQAKHYIGRLASHVKAVKVLVAAAVRLPNLFVDFLIVRVESPSSVKLPPGIRNQTRLDGIANRMVPAGEPNLLTEVQSRLEDLNARTDLEDRSYGAPILIIVRLAKTYRSSPKRSNSR